MVVLIFRRDLQRVRAHNESGHGNFEGRFGKTLFKLTCWNTQKIVLVTHLKNIKMHQIHWSILLTTLQSGENNWNYLWWLDPHWEIINQHNEPCENVLDTGGGEDLKNVEHGWKSGWIWIPDELTGWTHYTANSDENWKGNSMMGLQMSWWNLL